MDTQQEAYKRAYKPAPSGLRRLTPPMLQTLKSAERFAGVENTTPGQVLASFKAAAPFIGIRPGIVHAIDWLFRFTQPIDWQPGARPVVWPSAAMQAQDLCLGTSQVKNLNRQLVELGLVMMKDSPNGKRYGRRSPKGQIIEAYGFDLSPMADRLAEFHAVAEEGRAVRARVQALRRRATIARNGLRQLLEAAQEEAISDFDLSAWTERAGKASRGIAAIRDVVELEFAVASLERTQSEARAAMERSIQAAQEALYCVDNGPKRPEIRPHITTTSQLINPKDTVIAHEEGNSGHEVGQPKRVGALASQKVGAPEGDNKIKQPVKAERKERTDLGSVMKMTPDDLVRLAPRLRPYLPSAAPNWPEIVDAADWLRHDLGVSKPLWGEACLAMGREQAAIAIAIVSTKPPEHFRSTPGGYFRGMVVKAKAGELHLSRTLWGMRDRKGAESALSRKR